MSYRYSSLLDNEQLTEECVEVVTRGVPGSSTSPTTPTLVAERTIIYSAAEHGRLHGFLRLLSDRRSRRLAGSRKNESLDQNDHLTQSKAGGKAEKYEVDQHQHYYMDSGGHEGSGSMEPIKKLTGRSSRVYRYKKMKHISRQCSAGVEPQLCTEILVS